MFWCYPRHNSPWIFCVAGCYSRHSLRVSRCYRQHIWRVVIHGTVRIFRARVVIHDTGQNRCYLRHISPFYTENRVVIGGTFAFRVVIPDTIRRGCYRQHICREGQQMPFSYLTIIHHIFTGQLLFTAQFRVLLNTAQFGIFLLLFTAHFVFGLLFTAQFQNCCYLRHNSEKRQVVIHDTVSVWVVILGTVVVGCKRGHNLWWLCAKFQRLLFTAQFGIFVGGLLCCAQFSLVLLSLAQFAPLLGTAHCLAAHSCVVRPGTKPLLRPAQFGCYPRHSSSYFSKIIKALRE